MWRNTLFVIALALVASPAAAVDWVYVGKNTFGSVYEVDADSLTRSGNVVTFHMRVRYGPDGPTDGEDGYVGTRRADCSDNSYVDLATDYLKDGKIVRTSGPEEKRIAPPTSVSGEVLRRACARGGLRAKA